MNVDYLYLKTLFLINILLYLSLSIPLSHVRVVLCVCACVRKRDKERERKKGTESISVCVFVSRPKIQVTKYSHAVLTLTDRKGTKKKRINHKQIRKLIYGREKYIWGSEGRSSD